MSAAATANNPPKVLAELHEKTTGLWRFWPSAEVGARGRGIITGWVT